jgi:probable addiction module antidote protein
MAKQSRPYETGLHERLRDPSHVVNYLKVAIEDSMEGFLLALRDVAEATKGMSNVATAADKNRENLYRMLSSEGNPRLDSLWAVLEAMGLRLSVEPLSEAFDADPAHAATGGITSFQPDPFPNLHTAAVVEPLVVYTMTDEFRAVGAYSKFDFQAAIPGKYMWSAAGWLPYESAEKVRQIAPIQFAQASAGIQSIPATPTIQ